MKTILIFSAVFFLQTHAQASVISCSQLDTYEQDEKGNGYFQPSDITVEVIASATGPYGFQAIITSGTQTLTETDVDVSTLAASAVNLNLEELVQLVLPQLTWQDVKSVRVGNIGVKANRDDAAGIMLYELFDGNNVTLGKVATIGWSFGRCGL